MFLPTAITGTMPSFLRSSGTMAISVDNRCWQLSIFLADRRYKPRPPAPGHAKQALYGFLRPAPTRPAIPRNFTAAGKRDVIDAFDVAVYQGATRSGFSTRSTSRRGVVHSAERRQFAAYHHGDDVILAHAFAASRVLDAAEMRMTTDGCPKWF